MEKERENFIAEHSYRLISRRIAPYLTIFTPNQISFIGVITALISGIFFYIPNYLLAFIFLQVTILLDHIDGDLARYNNKNNTSLGIWVDALISNKLHKFFFILGASIGVFRTTNNPLYLTLGTIAIFNWFFTQYISESKKMFAFKKSKRYWRYFPVSLILYNLLGLSALLNRVDIALWFFSIFGLVWIKQIYDVIKQWRNMIKIPLKKLKEMQKLGGNAVTSYIHSNPIIRWVFWKRFEVLLDMMEKGEKVLEFGAGFGLLLPELSKRFEEVHCIDYTIKPLEEIKRAYELNNVVITKSKGIKLPYDDNSFDTAIVCDVLEHFEDSFDILQEFKRVLKKDGKLMGTIPTENWLYSLARFFLYWRKQENNDYAEHLGNSESVKDTMKMFFDMEEEKYVPFRFPIFMIFKAKRKEEI